MNTDVPRQTDVTAPRSSDTGFRDPLDIMAPDLAPSPHALLDLISADDSPDNHGTTVPDHSPTYTEQRVRTAQTVRTAPALASAQAPALPAPHTAGHHDSSAVFAGTDRPASSAQQHGTARQRILDLLLSRGGATQRELRHALNLSMPTVTAQLKTLETEGLVAPLSLRRSTGGRQPQVWGIAHGARTAIGVEIRGGGVTLVAADLAGTVIARLSRALPFRDNDAYTSQLDLVISRFAAHVAEQAAAPIGVAFAVPGVLTADGTAVAVPEPDSPAPLTLARLAKGLPLPASMLRHAAALAAAEAWPPGNQAAARDAICLYLNLHPAGALLMAGHPRTDGVLEHLPVDPAGPRCFCGQRGCMTAVCSPTVLMEDGESLSGFFSVLEQGEREHRHRFDVWLDSVARTVVTIRSVIAGDVILGGQAAEYLDDTDLMALRTRISALSPIPAEQVVLRPGCHARDQAALGAALSLLAAEADVLRFGGTSQRASTMEL